jgi:hypothetical protein
MRHQDADVIGELAQKATLALFSGYGLDLTPASHTPPDSGLVAVIGFTSPELRGAMALLLSEDVVRATHTIHAHPSEAERRDWAGELANQLLGRVKNLLIAWGPVVSMSTPMVVSGNALSLGGRFLSTRTACWSSAAGPLQVTFEMEGAPTLQLSAPLDDAPEVEEEGACLLF